MLGKCRMLSERVVEVWLLSLLGKPTASAADCEIFTHVRCMPRLRNVPEQCRAELNASATCLQEALPGAVDIGAYRSVRCAADDLIDKANACISTVKIRFEADEVAVAREQEVALLSAQGDQRGITELLASLSSLLAARYPPTLQALPSPLFDESTRAHLASSFRDNRPTRSETHFQSRSTVFASLPKRPETWRRNPCMTTSQWWSRTA